jgi:hypothetical protein
MINRVKFDTAQSYIGRLYSSALKAVHAYLREIAQIPYLRIRQVIQDIQRAP